MRSLLSVTSFVLVSALCSTVMAQSTSVAEALFRDALKLYEAGETRAACEKFAESFRLDPANGTLQNLAACHESDGKLASAWSEWSLLAGRASEAKQAAREAFARRKATELEPRLFRLQLSVHAGIDAIEVDGKALAAAAWTTALPLDPGPHVVTFRAKGFKAKTTEVLAAAVAATHTVVAPTLEREPAAPRDLAAPEAQAPAPQAGNGLRVASYVALGAGGVGFALGTVFGAMAISAKNDLPSHCTGNLCDEAGLSTNERAHGLAGGSTAAFVAGSVLAGAGLTMFLLSGPRTARGGGLAARVSSGRFDLRGSF